MARYATAEERAQRRAEAREAEARYRRGESTYAEWQKTRHESRPVASEVWALLSERGLGYKQGQEEPTNADIWAAYDELGLEWAWVVSAIDRTPAEARAIEAIEDTEDTEMQRALVGADICEAHWEHEEELELAQEARERKARLVAGTATEEDILGALDWADCRTEAEQIVADKDPHHTVAGRYAEMALDGWHEDEMADRLARTYEEWGCEISEAYRLANAHFTEELGEGWNR